MTSLTSLVLLLCGALHAACGLRIMFYIRLYQKDEGIRDIMLRVRSRDGVYSNWLGVEHYPMMNAFGVYESRVAFVSDDDGRGNYSGGILTEMELKMQPSDSFDVGVAEVILVPMALVDLKKDHHQFPAFQFRGPKMYNGRKGKGWTSHAWKLSKKREFCELGTVFIEDTNHIKEDGKEILGFYRNRCPLSGFNGYCRASGERFNYC